MAQLRYVLLAVTLVVLVGVSAVAVNVPNAFVAGETISASEMNANFAAFQRNRTTRMFSQPGPPSLMIVVSRLQRSNREQQVAVTRRVWRPCLQARRVWLVSPPPSLLCWDLPCPYVWRRRHWHRQHVTYVARG